MLTCEKRRRSVPQKPSLAARLESTWRSSSQSCTALRTVCRTLAWMVGWSRSIVHIMGPFWCRKALPVELWWLPFWRRKALPVELWWLYLYSLLVSTCNILGPKHVYWFEPLRTRLAHTAKVVVRHSQGQSHAIERRSRSTCQCLRLDLLDSDQVTTRPSTCRLQSLHGNSTPQMGGA